jgi:ABC-type sugar transport system substrate-binding protein
VHLGLFLVQSKNLFQRKLLAEAEQAAARQGVSLEVAFADGDARSQREQLFAFVRRDPAPDGLLVQPVEGSGIRFVVQEANQKGLGWAFINRHPRFLGELRSRGLVFSVTVDNVGIGNVQGEQLRVLLPAGGTVLCVTGPLGSESVVQRLEGLESTKGAQISLIQVPGDWTEEGGGRALAEWLETTRGFVAFNALAGHNDDMAIGARSALERFAASIGQPDLAAVPVIGVDGMPEFGQRLVAEGKLAATVVMPPTSGRAVEVLVSALRGGPPPPAEIRLPVESHPQPTALRPGYSRAAEV